MLTRHTSHDNERERDITKERVKNRAKVHEEFGRIVKDMVKGPRGDRAKIETGWS